MFFKGTRQTLPGISGESKVPRAMAAEHQDFFIYCGTAVCRVKPISIMPSTTPRGKRPNDQKGRVHHLIKQITPTIRSRRRIVAETLAYNVQHIIALKLRQTATILSGNNPPPKTLSGGIFPVEADFSPGKGEDPYLGSCYANSAQTWGSFFF